MATCLVTVATLAMEEEIIGEVEDGEVEGMEVEDMDIIAHLGGALVVVGAPPVEEVLVVPDPLPVSSYFLYFYNQFCC